MKLLIVSKPVLTNQMEIMSYCFRYERAEEFLDPQPARMAEDLIRLPCLDLLHDVGLNGFTNGMPLFVPINKFTLLVPDVALTFSEPADKIIFLLCVDTEPEEMFLSCIRSLKEKGFRFAVEGVRDYDYMHPILELCDFIMISFKNNRDGLAEFDRATRRYPTHTFIATNVDSPQLFDRLKYSGFGYFEGTFYRVPVSKEQNALAPVKVNRIQLINIVREPDFSIEEVVGVVSRDPSLTISLLKLVNSPYLGLSQKVTGIQQAVALLGQVEVRKWVATATAGLLASDRPQEITRISLLRAKFAENLARHFEKALHSQALFLMGLFSVLDVILEMPMYNALKIVSVTDTIHEALVYRDGEYMPILNLITSYEAADWIEVKRIVTLNNLNVADVFKAYIDAVQWYDTLVSQALDFEGEEGA
ncbi:MAG: HDOD domain-containing protein [Defluviitaleaceae bacterium]|nr:HDOD domain-containing protein [Defluviitaleaceae bacterium]